MLLIYQIFPVNVMCFLVNAHLYCTIISVKFQRYGFLYLTWFSMSRYSHLEGTAIIMCYCNS